MSESLHNAVDRRRRSAASLMSVALRLFCLEALHQDSLVHGVCVLEGHSGIPQVSHWTGSLVPELCFSA